MKKSREFFVGLIALVGMVLLLGLTFSLRNWEFFSNRVSYYALFPKVKKLNIGSPVLVYGVESGEVVDLKTVEMNEYRVRVTMRIDREVNLYPDVDIVIRPAGVIGDTTISVEAGRSESGQPLQPGALIRGRVAPELEEIATVVSEEATRALGALSTLLSDEENQQLVKQTLRNLAQASEKMDRSFDLFNTEFQPILGELSESVQRLNSILDTAEITAAETRDTIRQSREELVRTSEAWNTTAETLTGVANRTGDEAEQALARLNAVMRDNEQAVARTLDNLEGATAAMQEILAMARRGEGTLGALLLDRRPFDRLNELLSALTRTLTGSREPGFAVPPGEPRAFEPPEVLEP